MTDETQNWSTWAQSLLKVIEDKGIRCPEKALVKHYAEHNAEPSERLKSWGDKVMEDGYDPADD